MKYRKELNSSAVRLIVVGIIFMFLVPAGSLGGSGFDSAPVLAATVDAPDINTVVMQMNGTEMEDTFIWEHPDFQASNYGATNFLAVGIESYGNELNGMVRFPVDGISDGNILSATLSFYVSYIDGNDNDNMGLNVAAHPVVQPWTEGSGDYWATPLAYGSKNDTNWNNRTDGVQWGAPGGDYLTTIVSYATISHDSAWLSFNITDAVEAWKDGSMPNYGLMLTAEPVNSSAYGYVWFLSSDYTADPELQPKLIITYGAQIDPPVASITTNEDTPVNIDLSGRGHGTVVHDEPSNALPNSLPFFGGASTYDECHYQALYYPEEVGAEGKIMRIGFNRTNTIGANYSNLRISMAHTNLTSLTNTFSANYDGYLTEVFNETEVMVNSSDGDTWVYFDLNGNFTYDSFHNLLVDIQWQGDGGKSIALQSRDDSVHSRRAFANDVSTDTASTSTTHILARFYVDVEKNGGLYSGTSPNSWPFSASASSMHLQTLWQNTDIGGSGEITKFYMQASSSTAESATFKNLSIRIAHSTNTTLGTVFEANHVDGWLEVINSTSYTISTTGRPEWIEFDFNTPFHYNGNDNIVVDFRWQESSGANIDLAINYSASYAGQMGTDNYSATTGNIVGDWVYNVRFEFADYPSFTWSATSSNTSLFTASIMDNKLHIEPVANAYGSGTVELTLHNGAYTTTQTIPVTINPVNDAPVISSLPAITCTEDVPYALDMSAYISDVDNDISDLSISVDSDYAVVNGTVITFLYPEGMLGDTVNITVEDPQHLSATVEVQVTVIPVNDPPAFSNFVDVLTCDATVPKTYDLRPVDEETAAGDFTIRTDSSYASVSGNTITFLYPKGVGSQSVHIYLLDENIYGTQNNVSYLLNVTVIDHPEVVSFSHEANHITVRFDMDMNMASVESAFSMAKDGSAVSGTFVWSDAKTFVFTPSEVVNGTYDITVGTGAMAATGAPMLSAYSGNYTAPAGLDSDGDGMPDSWEIANGFNPLNSSDAATDADHDGLSNLLEYRDGTQPKNNDTDGDGIVDGFDPAPLTPAEEKSAAMALDPMMILVILLLIVVVVLAILLVRKKPESPAPAQQPQEYAPAEGVPVAYEGQQQEQPAYSPPVEESPEAGGADSGQPVPDVEQSAQDSPAEEVEEEGEILDLNEF